MPFHDLKKIINVYYKIIILLGPEYRKSYGNISPSFVAWELVVLKILMKKNKAKFSYDMSTF